MTPSSRELRVLSWNVRSMRDDVAALARVVRACEPDVVAVQEAPRFARWRSRRAELARSCGLLVATADRPGGLVVLVALRASVQATSYTPLSTAPRHHRRAVVAATVEVAGEQWSIASSHLSTDATERARHLPELSAALETLPGRLVLGVDLNESPDGSVASALGSRWSDAWAVAGRRDGAGLTSPAAAPRRRLDAVLVDPAVRVVSCEAVAGVDAALASDHLPVLAVLQVSG